MTDTAATPAARPGVADQIKGFIADLARPFAIYATGGAAAVAVVKIADKVSEHATSFDGAAIFITAVFAGVGALYAGKVYENVQVSKHDAQVQIAQATGGTAPAS